MSSRNLQDEEERLRQKLKRKAEERKSTGNGTNEKMKETERLPDSNGHGFHNDAPIESGKHDGSGDMRKRSNPSSRPANRDFHQGPRDPFGRLPPPNYPGYGGRGGGPYHDYPPRRDDGPPFHRGAERRMDFPPRFRDEERPLFRGEGPRGGGYYPPHHSRMDDFQPREHDFQPREPFPYDGGYRGPVHFAANRATDRSRDFPTRDRGIEEHQNRRSTTSRRPSVSSSSDRSDRSDDSHSTSSDRSTESSRSISSAEGSSDQSDSDKPTSRRDRKDNMESSDLDSGHSKLRHAEKSKVRPNEQDSIEIQIPKEKRTIFVSQLVMRVNEDDLYRFFRSECGCKVVDVIFLRDKRTGRHKGCSYVELARLEDIPLALEWNDKAPPFQRFPIAIKAPDLSFLTTDATAAYLVGLAEGTEKAVETLTESTIHSSSLMGSSNVLNVYVGNIDRNVTQPQLQAIFSQFGDLDKVSLQVDVTTGISKGFCFFGFRDPKVANLCIQVRTVVFGIALVKQILQIQLLDISNTGYVRSNDCRASSKNWLGEFQK